MTRKNPAPTEVGHGAEFDNAGAQNLVPLHIDHNTSDLARIPGEVRVGTPSYAAAETRCDA